MVTGSDNASKLFLTIIYVVYSEVNLDYGSMLWAQFFQSTLSVTRHNEISCARFWSIIVRRAINRLNIPVTGGSIIFGILVFHTSNVILSDSLWFTFIRSFLEAMLRNVPADSEVINAHGRQSASGACPLTVAMRQVLEEANKTNKGESEKRRLDLPSLLKLKRRKSSESLASP